MNAMLNRNAPMMLSVLRIMTGLLFLAHGTQKFLSFPEGKYSGVGWGFDTPVAFAGIFELKRETQRDTSRRGLSCPWIAA